MADQPSLLMKLCVKALLFVFTCSVWAAGETRPSENEDQARPFKDYTADTFRRLYQARATIDSAHLDGNLLAAAVFHETNKRRQNEGLPPLGYHAKLTQAALMQAGIMAERGSISHVNPGVVGKETPADRFRLVGLDPAFTAENVAIASGLRYKEREAVYTREENGRKLFSREPQGKPIEMHSYLTFAEALLDSWMASPLHRQNIVSHEATHLAASCEPKTNKMGMPVFFCAQVFYKPVQSAGKTP